MKDAREELVYALVEWMNTGAPAFTVVDALDAYLKARETITVIHTATPDAVRDVIAASGEVERDLDRRGALAATSETEDGDVVADAEAMLAYHDGQAASYTLPVGGHVRLVRGLLAALRHTAPAELTEDSFFAYTDDRNYKHSAGQWWSTRGAVPGAFLVEVRRVVDPVGGVTQESR